MSKNYGLLLKVLSATAFVFMIILNIMANALPINGMSTGMISEMYHNLFAPAGITFSIWGLIYLLLLLYVFFQAWNMKTEGSKLSKELADEIRIYFIISSFANGFWIISWHYLIIPLSLILMGIIFYCLMRINSQLSKISISRKEAFAVRLPFSIYFGWISVAMLANIIVFMVSLGWESKDYTGILVTIIFLIGGVALTGFFTLKNRDILYGLVPVWAYTGILIRHRSSAMFAGEYTAIIAVIWISLIVLIAILAVCIYRIKGLNLQQKRI